MLTLLVDVLVVILILVGRLRVVVVVTGGASVVHSVADSILSSAGLARISSCAMTTVQQPIESRIIIHFVFIMATAPDLLYQQIKKSDIDE